MEEDHHMSGASARAAAPLDAIPTRGYTMPPPTFRVKREFATWDIDHTRFEIKKVLGKGSYGVVAEAFDHLTKRRVAIKKINTIFDVFENSKRIYREVRPAPRSPTFPMLSCAAPHGKNFPRSSNSLLPLAGPDPAPPAAPLHRQAAARVVPRHQ